MPVTVSHTAGRLEVSEKSELPSVHTSPGGRWRTPGRAGDPKVPPLAFGITVCIQEATLAQDEGVGSPSQVFTSRLQGVQPGAWGSTSPTPWLLLLAQPQKVSWPRAGDVVQLVA